MARDTGPAKLPALPFVTTGNVGLDRLLQAICERLEVREGSRGNPYERTLLVRDIAALGVDPALVAGARGRTLAGTMAPGDATGRNGTKDLSNEAFSEAIRNSRLYQHLLASLNDPARFKDLPEKIQSLLTSIADEALKRGADVRELNMKIQNATESLAYRITEITAAVDSAQSGVRQLAFASANANNATAGIINQVQARLDGFAIDADMIDATVYPTLAALTAAVPLPSQALYYQVDDPESVENLLYRWDGSAWWLAGRGTSGTGQATLEQSMIATADRVKGVSAEYMVKVAANGASAGFGLAASEDPEGNTESAFIVQAGKFAVVAAGDVILDPKNPPLNRIPFGIDTETDTVYINGQVRINAGGQTLDDLASGTAVYIGFDTQFFKYDATGAVVNPTVTLSANLTGALADIVPAAKVTWTTLGGYAGALPAAGTDNTLVLAVADMTADGATFQATYVDGATTYTDVVTVLKLRDGTSALSAILTNEAYTAPASNAGTVSSWAGAGGQMQVFRGSTRLTSGVTYSVLTNPSGLIASINTSGVYAVTGAGTWPDGTATATLTLRATVSGTVIDKIFTLTKTLAGAPGGTGAKGDSVDIVFIRSASQPATPADSSGTPAGWFTDAASVTASANPMYSSVGTKVSGATNYTWDTPLKIEGSTGAAGLSIVELTVYTRGVPTTTPSGGSYNFGTKVLTVPTSTGATWTAAIPAGTTALYVSKATASIQGTTGSVATGAWTVPVVSMRDGEDGAPGTPGATGPRGSLSILAVQDGLTAYPTRAGGKARWSASSALFEGYGALADTAATAAICAALGVTASTANLSMGDQVTLTGSPGGVTWGAVTTGGAGIFTASAYGAGTYVLGNDAGALRTSVNGTSWTARTSPFGASYILALDYGLGVFVAGGQSGKRAYSTDGGVTWIAGTVFGGGTDVRSIAYGNGLWVAVGGNKCETSVNGIAWTATSTPFAANFMLDVAYGAGVFVAVGQLGALYTSRDGVTWTSRTSGFGTSTINAVCYGDSGLFVAAGASGKITATDVPESGWPTAVNAAAGQALNTVYFSNALYLAAGASGTLYTSKDGLAWTAAVSGFGSAAIYTAMRGADRFILAGASALARFSSSPAPVSVTGYWSGAEWLHPGVAIDGNLIVSGTVSAGTGAFSRAVIKPSAIYVQNPQPVVNGIAEITFGHSGIGTPLWSWACDPGAASRMTSLIWIFNTETTVTFRLQVFDMATATPFTGNIGTLKIWVY